MSKRRIIVFSMLLVLSGAVLWNLSSTSGYALSQDGAMAYVRDTHKPSHPWGGDVSVAIYHHPRDETVAFAIYTISGYAGHPFANSYFLRWQDDAWELKQPPLLTNATIGIVSPFDYHIEMRSLDCSADECWLEVRTTNDTHGIEHVIGWLYNPVLRSIDNGETWLWWHDERQAWVSDSSELLN